jgi:hypothetical protein
MQIFRKIFLGFGEVCDREYEVGNIKCGYVCVTAINSL